VTWSLVARDPATGALGAAVATRFLAAAGLCLNVAAGVGALSTQATINPTYGARGLHLLREGQSAAQAVAELIADDEGRDHRQVHAVDSSGRVGASTGAACVDWAGHVAADGVSVAGNVLAGPAVVQATLDGYQAGARLPFAERIITAMQAGQRAGGDGRGQQSAGILIFGTEAYPDLSLRVDDHPAPLEELRRIYDLWLVEFAAARKYMATAADPVGVYDGAIIDAEVRRRQTDPAARTFPV
jgi:uncharacterized Ntn-hydrolase superfamily protein